MRSVVRLESGGSDRSDSTLTPMIDVVFLLLVFFVWTTSFRAAELTLPSQLSRGGGGPAESPPPDDFQPIVLRIAWRDPVPVWTIHEIPLESPAALSGLLEQIFSVQPEAPIVVHPDADVPVQWVIQAYDLARRAGFVRVALAASQSPPQPTPESKAIALGPPHAPTSAPPASAARESPPSGAGRRGMPRGAERRGGIRPGSIRRSSLRQRTAPAAAAGSGPVVLSPESSRSATDGHRTDRDRAAVDPDRRRARPPRRLSPRMRLPRPAPSPARRSSMRRKTPGGSSSSCKRRWSGRARGSGSGSSGKSTRTTRPSTAPPPKPSARRSRNWTRCSKRPIPSSPKALRGVKASARRNCSHCSITCVIRSPRRG